MSSHYCLFPLFFLTLSTLSHSSSSSYLKLPLLPGTTLPHTLAASLRRPQSPLTSGAATGSGQYFADLRLGSPPQRLLLVADTGSDLVWVKCSACRNCSKTRSTFLPRHSSSFSLTHCYDSLCQLVPHPQPQHCNNRSRTHTPCHYQYSYADSSTTRGLFSKETTTFNTATITNITFGCGFKTSGPSVTGSSFNGAQGVLGLGRGPISFTSQLARKFGNTFSYCLLDYTLSPPPKSYLTIGSPPNDTVSRSYTPLLTNPFSPSFYYITILRVSVDAVNLKIDPSVWRIDANGNGGTVVDSGTTLTFLAEPAYRLLLAAFRRRLRLPAVDAAAFGFDLCVNVSATARPRLPRLRFRLAGKAVLSPPAGNYFIEPVEGVKCLAVQPVRPGSGFSVMGNLMQQGYLFEFDLDRSRIGFSRRGCAVR
ncbi:hypothetical protein VNO78_09544 [Psophocarpus tetragonolobus]|uniref:Peptidase A1 domain-containing protein n=1 Tax=Psophocarpus tetragonolobus TaxID=3891 RepID=A0AAN9SWI7_PSOTE